MTVLGQSLFFFLVISVWNISGYNLDGTRLKDLYSTDSASLTSESAPWVISSTSSSNRVTQCGPKYYFGGANILNPHGSFSRQYINLPPHDIIHFSISFALYDTVDITDYIKISFGSVEFLTQTNPAATPIGTNIILTNISPCGNGNKGGFFTFQGKALHTGDSVTLTLTSEFDEVAANENFGFRDINLLFLYADPGDATGRCLQMSDMHFTETTNLCPCNPGSYPSSSPPNCFYCDQSCSLCMGPSSSLCLDCKPTFFWNGTDCRCRDDQAAVQGQCLDCHDTCSTCYGPAPAECSKCFQGRYMDGTSCFSCDPSCVACDGGGSNQCTKCKSDEYLEAGVCKPCHSSCEACFGGSDEKCTLCKPGKFFLAPSSCIADCPPPLMVDPTALVLTCSYGCAIKQFLYPGGSCEDMCNPPFTATTQFLLQFCKSPCTGTDDILKFNGACSTDCLYPMQMKDTPDGPICSPACEGGFLYQDSTCLSSCNKPLQSYEYAGYKMCAAPLCFPSGEYSNSSNTTTGGTEIPRNATCPDNYGCTPTGLCVPVVSNQLEALWIMTLTNGYLLSVRLVRQGEAIPELDNQLIMTVNDLVEGVDYKGIIIPDKKTPGNFEVRLMLLRAIAVDPLKVNFLYSPLRMKLKASLYLTRITFITPAILEAAKNLESSSQAVFTAMAASSVGFTLIGKLGNMWSFLAINQYMHHLLYLKMPYLPHTVQYLRSLANYNIILLKMEYDMTTDIRQMRDLRLGLPSRFMDEKYAPDLFVNTAQILAIVSVMIGILALASTVVNWKEKPPKIAVKAQASIKWNGLFRQLLTYCLPLTIASLVQLHFSLFSGKDDISFLNLLTAVVVLIGIVLGMARAYPLIDDIPNKQFRRVVHLAKYGSLYLGLNQKSRTRHYFWFIALRGLLLAYMVVFFEYFPTVQIGVLVAYQGFIISLFVDVKGMKLRLVFQDRVTNVLSLTTEMLLLLKKLMILGVLKITPKTLNASLLINFGWGIIGPGILIQLVQVGYALFIQWRYRKKIFSAIKGVARKICGKKKKRKINRVWPLPSIHAGGSSLANADRSGSTAASEVFGYNKSKSLHHPDSSSIEGLNRPHVSDIEDFSNISRDFTPTAATVVNNNGLGNFTPTAFNNEPTHTESINTEPRHLTPGFGSVVSMNQPSLSPAEVSVNTALAATILNMNKNMNFAGYANSNAGYANANRDRTRSWNKKRRLNMKGGGEKNEVFY